MVQDIATTAAGSRKWVLNRAYFKQTNTYMDLMRKWYDSSALRIWMVVGSIYKKVPMAKLLLFFFFCSRNFIFFIAFIITMTNIGWYQSLFPTEMKTLWKFSIQMSFVTFYYCILTFLTVYHRLSVSVNCSSLPLLLNENDMKIFSIANVFIIIFWSTFRNWNVEHFSDAKFQCWAPCKRDFNVANSLC